MITEREDVQALVFSGGAAFAAYEVGVTKALLRGESPSTRPRPVLPRIVSGTSAGAFNAALLVSQAGVDPEEEVRFLETIWLDRVADQDSRCGDGGVFRWRGNPLNFFGVDCLASNPAQWMSDRLEDAVFFSQDFARRGLQFALSRGALEQRFFELFDFSSFVSTTAFPQLVRRVVRLEEIRRSPRILKVAATNFDTGDLELFGNEDLTDDVGDLILRASAATPGIFPPVTIGTTTYVDGGVLMNTPLRPAIRCGATTLHVVYLDPNIRDIPISDLQTSMGTLQRILAISTAANFNRDIEQARRINLGLEVLERDTGDSRLYVEAVGNMAQRRPGERPYRPLTIHRYHPGELLGGPLGFLDFTRPTLEGLIERGYRDALEHDCEKAGCVLPDPSVNESVFRGPKRGQGGDHVDA